MPYLLAYLPSKLAPGSNFYYLVLIFSLEFWFVADAKLTYQVVIIKDDAIFTYLFTIKISSWVVIFTTWS